MIGGTMVVTGRGRIGNLGWHGLGQDAQAVTKNSIKAAQSVPDIDSGTHLLSALEFMSNLSRKSGAAVSELRSIVKDMGERPADYAKEERENAFTTLAILEDIYNKSASFMSTTMEVDGAGAIRWIEVSQYLIEHLNGQGVSLYVERWTGPGLGFEEVPFPAAGRELHSRFISNGARTSLFEDFKEISDNEKALRGEAAKAKVSLDGFGFVSVVLRIVLEIGKWLARFMLGKGFIRAIAQKGLARALFSGTGVVVVGGVAATYFLPDLFKGAGDVVKESSGALKELLSGARAAAFGVGTGLLIGGGVIALIGGYFLVKNLSD